MTREEVIAAIKVMLQEEPESEHQVDWLMRCPNFDILFDTMLKHTKFKQKTHDTIADMVGSKVKSQFEDAIFEHKQNFLAPKDLQTTTLKRKRVLLIGQCFFYDWRGVAEARRLPVDAQQFVIGYQHEVPDNIMEKGDEFDFQILQAPIRAVIPEVPYFRMALDNVAGFEHLFKISKERLETFVRYMTKFNIKNNLETYFCNFITPQASISGRFCNRYELNNILYFIDELNKHLYNLVMQLKNVYYVDLNNIASVYGKMFVRDDVCMSSLHGGTLTNRDAAFDAGRLVVSPPATDLYSYNHTPFVAAAWNEVLAMHRTIHAIDAVKMVVVDLDDTLWRGLIGEGTAGDLEGWPVGFSEALLQLKQRGILLAIISKNDEAVVRANWTKVLGATMSLEDFAIVKINYRPKPENMAEVLNLANIISRSVIFVDDNPVEREAMKAAFPDIRVLGDLPLYFKRTLMWSSETQVAHLSSESIRRTEMVKAQAVREDERAAISREEFLANLGLAVEVETIDNINHPKFARAFELINKTNQFNTTGLRMTHAEAVERIVTGNVMHVFAARDKHTSYGLVGVLTCRGSCIEQFVMSCRVAGLDIELGVLSLLINTSVARRGQWQARLVHTNANLLCRDVYAKAGFRKVGDAENDETWIRELVEPVSCPAHLEMSADGLRIT